MITRRAERPTTLRTLLPAAAAVLAGLFFSACVNPVEQAVPANTVVTAPAFFECRWADGPISIDGQADDPAWQPAQIISNFAMPWLGHGAHPAPTATRARLLWDREFLYFFADMEDADVYADVTEHDGKVWLNDVFELFFKPLKDKSGYYEFEINAANTSLDMFLPSRDSGGWQRHKSDREFHLNSAVVVRGTLNQRHDKDGGWSVEGRIPWLDFVQTIGRPEPGEQWTFALCRYDYSVGLPEPALSTCAPLQRMDFHDLEDYAPLRFIGPKQTAQPSGLGQRVPWLNSRVVGSPDPPPPFRAVRAFPNLKTENTVAIASEPGSDRLLLIEVTKTFAGGSRLRRFSSRSDGSNVETMLELPEEMTYGLAFHPGFATNGFIFVGCNGPSQPQPRFTRIVRYTMERLPPFGINPASRHVIIEWESDGHNGGDLCFGNDGMLYVTSGDGTTDSDENVAGQDLGKLTSKVLRLDVDHPADGCLYSIPRDNPFLDVPGVRGETWAYGLRNPWRITVDRESGQLWIGENGQDLWEMARLVERGANYGWSVFEGSHPFYPNRKPGPQPVTPPTFEHPHSEARSLTGGVVYRGARFAELRGAYLYGDYSTGKIWGARHDGQKVVWHRELADTPLAVTGFGLDPDGELLIVDFGGGLYRLEPTPKNQDSGRFPTRLSETGLFVSTKDLRPDPALIPYSVNAPLWSDGAHKERFIALSGRSQIDFTSNHGWGFPEGAVLVKTFFLDLEAGNPASRRRLETRLLTKQQNEWVGYTYVWNDAQTDATLLGAAGADQEFTVRDSNAPGGARKQTWHFPSRAECMVCHSRAANFVLGLTEAQMNRLHDYGGGQVDNQLRVLERLGVLRANWFDYEREDIKRQPAGEPDKTRKELLRQLHAAESRRAPATNSVLLPRAPERLRKLADPADPAASLDDRARAYLQANCAQCHVRSGGGNAQIDLEFLTSRAEMKLFGERPQHSAFGLADARLVAPGQPEQSVLLRRMSNRDTGHMPPLATTRVDEQAVKLITEWIAEMKR